MIKIGKTKLIYLASLYATGAVDMDDLDKRYDRVLHATTKLLELGYKAFSPIVHNHPVNKLLKEAPGWSFWGPYDKNILKRCDCMVILADKDWETSHGIGQEIKFAKKKGIPIYLMHFSGYSVKFTKFTDA